MRGYGVAVSAVVSVLVLLSVSGPAPSDAIWQAILPALTSQLTSLWQKNELQFMDSKCFYRRKPHIYRWQLYYIGNFQCPTWSNIKGYAKTRNPSKVMVKTIEDYLNKAKAGGLVTEEEARVWLVGNTNK